MKANAPKRKVFADAMDFLTENASGAENDIQMINVDAIRPFRNHPFRLYMKGNVCRKLWIVSESMVSLCLQSFCRLMTDMKCWQVITDRMLQG